MFEMHTKIKEKKDLLISHMGDLDEETKDFYSKWALFLTLYDDVELNKIISVYYDCRFWGSAIMRYREDVRNRGRGVVNMGDIVEAYNSNNIYSLTMLLSERCLEYLSIEDVTLFLKNLKKSGWSIEKALGKLDIRPNARLLSLVC